VLRDTAGLSRRDARVSDGVEKRSLTVVNVSHYNDYRRPRLCILNGLFVLGILKEEFLVADNDLWLCSDSVAVGNDSRCVKVNFLVLRSHDALFKELHNDFRNSLLDERSERADCDRRRNLHIGELLCLNSCLLVNLILFLLLRVLQALAVLLNVVVVDRELVALNVRNGSL